MKRYIMVALVFAVIFSLTVGWQVHATNQPRLVNTASAPNLTSSDTGPGDFGVAFIKFDGIEGESQSEGHMKWSYIQSFDQLITAPTTPGGIRSGAPVFEDIIINKMIDKASPKLAEALALGKVFPKVKIDVCRSIGEGTQIFYAYELTNVIISRYWVGAGLAGETPSTRFVDSGRGITQGYIPLSVPVDQLYLHFEEINGTYTMYNDAGEPAVTSYHWKKGGPK